MDIVNFNLGRWWRDREAEVGGDGESVGHSSDAAERLLSDPSAVTARHRHFCDSTLRLPLFYTHGVKFKNREAERPVLLKL